MVFLKPLDEELVKDVAKKFKHIITVEDGCITGGLGTAVMECVNKNGLQSIVHRVGIPDRFVKQGSKWRSSTNNAEWTVRALKN